jgi:Flp pilus assembly protein TadG
MWKRVRGERGSALVETALTFPVFVAMILGAMQLGVMALGAIEVTNAARAGAQFAAMNGGGYNDPNGVKAAAQSDAGELTIISAPVSSSCICSDGSGACGSSSGVYSCNTGKTVVTITVTTTAQYPSLFKIPGLFSNNTFTLQGSAQQQVLN